MKKNRFGNVFLGILCAINVLLAGCTSGSASQASPEETAGAETEQTAQPEAVTAEPEKTGEIVVLYTSDIHCGVREGFGVVGLQQMRETLEKKGITTLLVDDGDAIQGDALGSLTQGSAVITLMNDLHYDAAIPGNHEFDYGMDNFLEVTKQAEFPYLSCNFNKEGEFLLDPYVIKEAAGKKIAFIGVTTPETLTSSNPRSFQNESGEYIYSFLQGNNGDDYISAIQKNVDEVREKGADYVVLMAHIGNIESDEPYNFQTIIECTSGIDVILDGHSHDTDQVTMNDKDGNPVIRSACGTKLANIGYMRISGEDGSIRCGIYSWPNDESAADLLGLENEMSEPLAKVYADLEETTKIVIGSTDVDLVISDPVLKNPDGRPKRIVRTQETNLADLTADAFRAETGAEISFVNGGGVRADVPAGNITYGDVLEVLPYFNELCITELSGQQILDGLEWACREHPNESGGFLHPSGLCYEIHADIPSSCVVGTNGMFGGVKGEYRVKNVTVNGEPLDLKRTYRVSGSDYIFKNMGDGFSMFTPENVIASEVMTDSQALIGYLQEELEGTVGERYGNPYGEGRITITGLD